MHLEKQTFLLLNQFQLIVFGECIDSHHTVIVAHTIRAVVPFFAYEIPHPWLVHFAQELRDEKYSQSINL